MAERRESARRSIWWRSAVGMLLASLTVACDPAPPTRPSPTTPTAPSPTPSPGPPSPVFFPRYQLSGRVTDPAGVPVSGAHVSVYHGSAGSNVSNPPSHCTDFGYCWLTTQASGLGDYAAEFAAGPMTGRGFAGGGIGFLQSCHGDYETTFQWLPTSGATATVDVRLRPARPISAGESTVVTVEADSSLCTDGEDLWSLRDRCEIVRIESGAGTLVVEGRAAQGSAVPLMFWYTSGSYTGGVRQTGPGTISIPAAGGTYLVLIGVPDGTASQQFVVSTSLR